MLLLELRNRAAAVLLTKCQQYRIKLLVLLKTGFRLSTNNPNIRPSFYFYQKLLVVKRTLIKSMCFVSCCLVFLANMLDMPPKNDTNV